MAFSEWAPRPPPPAFFGSPGPGPAPGPSPLPAFNFSFVNETLPELSAPEEEVFASLSILLHIFLLGITFVIGHILRRRKFYYVHEASAALIIGLVAGLVATTGNSGPYFRKWLNFKEEFFLLFLLPPIIFESGFSLQVTPFFSNFGAICTFAMLGTFIAAVVTGILVYIAGFLYLVYRLSFLESLIYGAVISATDPVTVLAIFQELGTDTNLYALVFGESVLNDAVAITMYRTLISVVQNPAKETSFVAAIQYAGMTFVGSLLIGVVVALSCSLLFKYAGLAVRNLHNLETCLIVLFPYIAYMVAEGYALSGIVAILFCGILMKHYTFPNLSDMAQILSAGFFHIIASLAETFVFIYMGVEIALGEYQSWSNLSFIIFSIIFIFIARAVNIIPCAYIVNWFRPPSKRIPETHQKALWCSGLRGAMAFALALQAVHDLPDGHGKVIFSSTTAIVMLTVLVIGGSTSTVLERLEVAGDKFQRLQAERANDSDEELHLMDAARYEGDLTPQEMLQRRIRIFQENTPSFSTIDTKYIRPFFTAQSEEGDAHSLEVSGADMEHGRALSPKARARRSREHDSNDGRGTAQTWGKMRSASDPGLGGSQAEVPPSTVQRGPHTNHNMPAGMPRTGQGTGSGSGTGTGLGRSASVGDGRRPGGAPPAVAINAPSSTNPGESARRVPSLPPPPPPLP